MKQSILAVTIAAALSVSGTASAATTIYGSARVSLDYDKTDSDRAALVVPNTWPGQRVPGPSVIYRDTDSKGFWDVYNNSSRLGVKGSEDLGNGLSAIYQYEFGVDMTDGGNFNSNRPKWVGLESESWGTVKLGTQWTPYYNVAGGADQFNSSKVFDTWDTRKCLIASNPSTGNTLWQPDAGRSCGSTYLGPFRYDNTVTYKTPDWHGFSSEAMLVLNGTQSNSKIATFSSDKSIPETVRLGTEIAPGTLEVVRDPSTGEPVIVTQKFSAETIKADGDKGSGIDDWQINVKYVQGPWYAGAAYEKILSSNDSQTPGIWNSTADDSTKRFVIGLGYNTNGWGIVFNFEQQKTQFNDVLGRGQDFKVRNYLVVGRYSYGNSIFRLSYGYLDPRNLTDIRVPVATANLDAGQSSGLPQYDPASGNLFGPLTVQTYRDNGNVNNFVAGWQYNFSERSRVWLEYFGRRDTNDGKLPFGNRDVVSIGMRHDF